MMDTAKILRGSRFMRRRSANPQDGTTLIEVMIAGMVLVVGFMGLMTLIITAIALNNRNRLDTQGWMLATAVLENLENDFARGQATPGVTAIVDCAGNSVTVNTAAGGCLAASGGNTFDTRELGSGIDFTEASPPGGYYFGGAGFNSFQVGGGGAGALCSQTAPASYDVRWRIDPLTAKTSLITVSVKLKGRTQQGDKLLALPTTLRTYAGYPN